MAIRSDRSVSGAFEGSVGQGKHIDLNLQLPDGHVARHRYHGGADVEHMGAGAVRWLDLEL